ncbi:MAG: hypothetical protein HY453_01515 [Parcubacteria group bacterium]|nr:hypothetical protein [Parcubacteria group bacterium]
MPDFFSNVISQYPIFGLETLKGNSLNVNFLNMGTGLKFTKSFLYKNADVRDSVSSLISGRGKKQTKIGFCGHFPQVGYYFNGKIGQPFDGEEWRILGSDDGESDSLEKVFFEIRRKVKEKKSHFIMAHLGNMSQAESESSLDAIEYRRHFFSVLEKIVEMILSYRGMIFLSSDFYQENEEKRIFPFMVVGKSLVGRSAIRGGDVYSADLNTLKCMGTVFDVGPSILGSLGIESPKNWEGKNLLERLK